jgi:NADH-quinone oxidoreductase subunit M
MFLRALIPILVFAPALGALLQTLSPRPAVSRTLAIIASLLSALAAILLVLQMDGGGETPRFVVAWIRSYSIHFALGVDGLNVLPMLVTALVFPFLLISEWDRQFGRRGIHALLLLLECATLGALCAGDLFLLLFFLTLAPIPLYFLASIWGDEGRETSAFRMMSVSLVAGAALFFGVLLVYHAVDPHTFLIEDLAGKLVGKTTEIFGVTFDLEHVAFSLIVFGLALRAPFWPFQGWFRKFVLKVPTTVGVGALLAGFPVTLSVFTRLGFLLFPEMMKAHLDIWIGIGIANLVFGALTLLQETDLRGVLVSLSTLFAGFSLLGIGTAHPTGLVGSQFILFSSMISLAVWGFAAEIIRYRTRSYLIADTRGVLRTLPDLGATTLIAVACAVGVPGTAGFISFALLYMGYFSYHPGIVVASLFVSLVVTGFLIQTYRQIFLGEKVSERYAKLGFRERLLLIPLVGIALVVGFYPSPLVEIVRATVAKVLA